MTSPLPEAQWGFDKSLKGYPYDPAKAKQLLAAAGVKLPAEDRAADLQHAARLQPGRRRYGGGVAGVFPKVGIDVDVRKLDMGAFLATVRSGNYHGLFVTGWSGDNGDPDNLSVRCGRS